MAEPLRRTLGRLRERHAPGALGLHADSVAASLSEGRSPPHELAGPGMERPAWGTEQPGARVPWSRGAQEAAALGRALARASPGAWGSGDDDGEDEGADYYENLPAGCAPEGAEALRASPSRAPGSSPGMEGGRLETGRLQTQLREAYYLLIQAMHDLPPDSGTRRGGPAGARAQGQQPPLPRGAAVRPACSLRGGDRPPQQVSPPRSPPTESREGRPPSPRIQLSSCRSLESLRVSRRPPLLQRWASDSCISSQEDHPEDLPLKPPAVTVKKLQKWMYKGRLLSLGMKGRDRGTAPKVPGAQTTSPNLGSWKVHENHVLSVTTDQRITLTAPKKDAQQSSFH